MVEHSTRYLGDFRSLVSQQLTRATNPEAALSDEAIKAVTAEVERRYPEQPPVAPIDDLLKLNAAAVGRELQREARRGLRYRSDGYLVFDQPVLEPTRFDALRACFERLLAALPPGERPEAMDVPHFLHPELLNWALDPRVLALVEPILGPDLALFSTHFICKPAGHGKRVPWHEDSAYLRGQITPMEVCTVWLAIDPSTRDNGCMMVIPRSHVEGRAGFSDYDDIAAEQAVFPTEITKTQRDVSRREYVELQANQASLHDARIQRGSEANTSGLRRCGWTLRFVSTRSRFDTALFDGAHQVYLAQGVDHGGNVYADPTRAYPEVMQRRAEKRRYRHSH